MIPIHRLLPAFILWLPVQLSAQCPQFGGAYNGFQVQSVTVETPLSLPGWITRPLIGRGTSSLDPVAATLPIKDGGIFDPVQHTQAMNTLSMNYSMLTRPGERVRLALVTPRFPTCDLSARTVDVVYRVYSTDAAYFASRLLESADDAPDFSLSARDAAEKAGTLIPTLFAGYDDARHLFGGIKTAWTGASGLINSTEVEAGGSSTSYRAGVLLGGVRNPERGWLSHTEWKAGYRSTQDPSGDLRLTKSIGMLQAFAATRAYGPNGIMFRFGGAVELGRLESDRRAPAVLATAPQRVWKTFIGSTWSADRQIWNASYGFQLGKGTDATAVDYTKHLLDLSHQIRILPREHQVIQLDTHFNAGWILSSAAGIPEVERFYGGNLPADFVDNPLWKLPSGPQIRSFPLNRLNADDLEGTGGTSFFAVNVTAAFPGWWYPAIPQVVRDAKPLGDGIHLGLQSAQRASLEDFRARNDLFAAALEQATSAAGDLAALRNRLATLPRDMLSEELTIEIEDLLETWVLTALNDIATAEKVPNSGLAWSISHRLSEDDPDTYPLAHISASLDETVAPGLQSAGLAGEAATLLELARKMDAHKRAIAQALVAIESFAAVPQNVFDAFDADLAQVTAVAQSLEAEASPFIGATAPLGTLAFEVSEWSVSIASLADLGEDPDPFDSLYVLNRLAIGIGKLEPPQIEKAARAAYQLAATLEASDAAASGRIAQLAADLETLGVALAPKVEAIAVPRGVRWAREQNRYFVRALDVAFREMNLAAVSPIVAFDVARIGPRTPGSPALRYGIGPGVRFSIVSLQMNLGYSFNPRPQGQEKRGAWFLSMEVADLFR